MTLFIAALCLTSTVQADGSSSAAELKFITAIDDISHNRIDEAIVQFSQLTRQAPRFTLAKLIYADLLAARAGQIKSMGDTDLLSSSRLQALKQEAKIRVQYHQQKAIGNQVPRDLIQLTDNQPYAIMVDITMSRLYLFANDNGKPKLVKDFYASSGKAGADKYYKGDKKTPLGVYFITKRIPAEKLSSKYGAGALPLNYPNSWDYQLNKTGNGIWLHGSPRETYSRSPKASEGCVTLTNIDFTTLDKLVDITSTPVIIGRNIKWISQQQWRSQQVEFNRLIKTWVDDWESLNGQQYITHYSTDFKTAKDNYQSWTTRRGKANEEKAFINVDIQNLSLFTYPDDKGLLVASFNQNYQSNDFQGTNEKRQYWRKEHGQWKVVYEGEPSRGDYRR